MLNTIFEEFDLLEFKKKLSNKNIQLKKLLQDEKLIEHPYQNTSIFEDSTIMANSNFIENSRIESNNISKTNITSDNNSWIINNSKRFELPNNKKFDLNLNEITDDNKENNKMFLSEYNRYQNTFQTARINYTNKKDDEKTNNLEKKSKEFENLDRFIIKQENKLFKSHNIVNNKKNNICNEFDQFILSKDILRKLDDETKNIKNIEEHVKKEKQRINDDLNDILKTVNELIESKRNELCDYFDKYLTIVKSNYDHLKINIKEYKNMAFQSSKNNMPFLTIRNISFTGEVINRKEINNIKIKEENSKIELNLSHIKKEIKKKLINFYSDELNKQLIHLPLYNHSETSSMFLLESKSSLNQALNEILSNLDNLIYITPFTNLQTIKVNYDTTKLITDDHLKLICNKDEMNYELIQKFETDHSDSILCILCLNDNIIITGSRDSTIKIWNITLNKLIGTLKGHHSSINCLSIMNASPNDMKGQRNLFKSFLKRYVDKNDSFLISGGSDCKINVWDLNKNSIIKSLNGHKDIITSLISLKDGKTLVSSCYDGSIKLWDCLEGKEIQDISNISSINCMILLNEGDKFISGGNDGMIMFWNIIYQFSIAYQRTIVIKVELEKTIKDNCYIYSMINSVLNNNILITGGSDAIIKVWNIQTGLCLKEIKGHISPVCFMILIENGFKNNDDWIVLSCGTKEDKLRESKRFKYENEEIQLSKMIKCDYGGVSGPCIQLLKESSDGIRVIVPSENNSFLIIRMN